MAKSKKLTVKVGDTKLKDGDKVAVLITGTVRLSEYTWTAEPTTEVLIEYGDENEYYLNDAVEGKSPAVEGLTVVKL